MEKRKNKIIGPLLLLITAFLWGTTLIAQKLGSNYVGPFTYNFYRFTISGIILIVVFFIKRKISKKNNNEEIDNNLEPKSKRWIYVNAILVGVCLFIGASLQQFGIKLTTPGKAGFLSSTYMLMVPIIGIIFRKHIKYYVWVCVAIALVGSFLISYKYGDGFQIGDIVILISTLGYALQIIFVDRVGKYVDGIFLSALQLLITGLLSFILKVIFEPFSFEAFKSAFFAIMYAVVFSGCIAFTFQILGQRTTPPTIASMIMALESVFSLLASVVVLHETLTMKEWFGSALIFGSIVLYEIMGKFEEKLKMKKLSVLILLFLLPLFLISCTNKEKTKIQPETENIPTIVNPIETIVNPTETIVNPTETETLIYVTEISLKNEIKEIDIDEFNINDLIIIIKYSDDSIKEVNVTTEMVDNTNFILGDNEIKISYEGLTINYSFTLYKNYTVKFYVEEELIYEITVRSGEGITDVPAVPNRTGYDGSWNILDLSIITEDLIVRAVYEENDVMKIREVVKGLYEEYNYLLEGKINKDIELVSEFMDASITWQSSDEKVISNSGKYNRDYKEKEITLSATVTLGKEVRYCTFKVISEGFHDLSKPIVAGYLYRNYDKLTDEFFDAMDIIYCAFVGFTDSGDIPLTSSTLTKIKNYVIPKAHERGIYVIASMGGGGSAPANNYKNMTANATSLTNFANNCVKLINQYGFDGIDYDWETPSSSNSTSFTKMAKEVYNKVKANNPNHLLTSAIGGGMWQPPKYDLPNSIQYLDYVNVMTYGMCSNSGYYQNALFKHTTNDNTTYGCGRTLNSCSIEETIKVYNDLNVSNDKLIFGLAFYGIRQTRTDGSWGSGSSVLYNNILNNYINNSNYEVHYDEVAQVPYILSKDGNTFISYDNRASILAKAAYMIETGCAGLMNWEIGCDYLNYELTLATRDGLKYQMKE